MQDYSLESIKIAAPSHRAFEYISEPTHLPAWTQAFSAADDTKATMRTPGGEIDIELTTEASAARGTVDWHMTPPGGKTAIVHSRVVSLDDDHCIYSITLGPPEVSREGLRGELEDRSRILRGELTRLAEILEHGA